MKTQDDLRKPASHLVIPLQPYLRVSPSPNPAISCRVVIPGAAVVCTRIVSHATSQVPFPPARGPVAPDHPA